VHKTIECGWINFAQADLIAFKDVAHVVIESLAVKYTGSSAIGGGNVSHFVLRDCDIAYTLLGIACCLMSRPTISDELSILTLNSE
jgi:hypothetical protein